MRADTVSTWTGRSGAGGPAGAGGCSTTTCALVPPMPNELTPIRRGTPPVSHSRSSAFTTNGVAGKFGCRATLNSPRSEAEFTARSSTYPGAT